MNMGTGKDLACLVYCHQIGMSIDNVNPKNALFGRCVHGQKGLAAHDSCSSARPASTGKHADTLEVESSQETRSGSHLGKHEAGMERACRNVECSLFMSIRKKNGLKTLCFPKRH